MQQIRKSHKKDSVFNTIFRNITLSSTLDDIVLMEVIIMKYHNNAVQFSQI